MASSVDGPRLSSPLSLPDDPDVSEPDEPEVSEPDEPEVLVEPEDPDDPDDPLLEPDEGDGVDGTGTGDAVDGAGLALVLGALAVEGLGVELVFGGGVALGAAAAGAGAGGAGGGAWTGGGFSATVTVPGPSSEIATKATAVDEIANAITTPVMTAGTRQRRPLRASAVPHSRHHSWPSCTRAPHVAQVAPSGASWTGVSSGGSPGPGGRSSRAVAAPFSLVSPLAEESASAGSERSRRRRSVLTIIHRSA
jgi:hypothetical protein